MSAEQAQAIQQEIHAMLQRRFGGLPTAGTLTTRSFAIASTAIATALADMIYAAGTNEDQRLKFVRVVIETMKARMEQLDKIERQRRMI